MAMILLPAFNAALSLCPVNSAEFTVHPAGHFCGSCQRVVHDFSQSSNPIADLAAARAAAPDGRVCGSFCPAQVVTAPTLTRRLKWFLVALVLVVGQGLTAREALAQVRRPTIDYLHWATKHDSARLIDQNPLPFMGVVVEQMPVFRGGGMGSLTKHIQQQLKWPSGTGTTRVSGRIFISFTVGEDGLVHDAKVVKGLHPLFDAEALRVVKALTGFTPGRQNGKPVSVSMTVPVTFRLK